MGIIRKMKLVIVGLILILIFVIGFLYINFANPTIHILPNELKGPVFVVYNCPNGMNKKYKFPFRLLGIPSSGILRTQFSFAPGWTPDFLYNYQYENGVKIHRAYRSKGKNNINEPMVYLVNNYSNGNQKHIGEVFIISNTKDYPKYINILKELEENNKYPGCIHEEESH